MCKRQVLLRVADAIYILRESLNLLLRRNINNQKAKSKVKAPETQTTVLQNSRLRGHFCNHKRTFWELVKRRGRFINGNYPPDDMSQEELERIWGKPRKKDRNLLDDVKVKGK